jgi:protein TonB
MRAAAARSPQDPVRLVLGTPEDETPFYASAGVAFLLHATMLAFAILAGLLKDLHLAVEDNRARLHDYFWRVYDVEIPKEERKAEEKPAEAPPEPDAPPPPPTKAPAPKEEDPYKDLPPTPAKAAGVLTQKENPDEPVDLTKEANAFATGDGTATYGQVSAAGTGTAPVMSPHASLQGRPGGSGSAVPRAPAAPAEDKSRPISLVGGSSWNCPFPPEADADQIDQAVVTVQVTVKPDGSALKADVIADPGHGFARAARICALARRYNPALDRAGSPVLSSYPVNVRFNR